MLKCYKKFHPRTAVQLSNGRSVKFDTLDNVLGYFSTEEPYIQDEFKSAQNGQRGGIIDISNQEFEKEYSQKKMLYPPGFKPKPLNREEFTAPKPQETIGQSLIPARADAVSVAVSTSDINQTPPANTPPQPHGEPITPPASRTGKLPE